MYSQKGNAGDLTDGNSWRPSIHPDRKQENIKKKKRSRMEGTGASHVSRMCLLPRVWEGADDVACQWPEGLRVWGLTVLKALVHLVVPRAILSVEEAAVQGGGFQMAFRV